MPVLDWRVAPVAALLGSFSLIVLGIVGPLSVEDSINNNLEDEFLFVKSGQTGYNRWIDNLRPDMQEAYVYMYLYNVTNPEEAAAGQPPIIKDVGPYVYRLWLENIDPVFGYITPEGNLTSITNGLYERVVTFSIYQYFQWATDHPDNANRSEADLLTAPWFSFWIALETAPQARSQILLVAQRMGLRPFITKTVGEFIWGYNDTFLVALKSAGLAVDSTITYYIPNMTSPDAALGRGRSTVSCGFPNPARFQRYLIYEDELRLTQWPTQPKVGGSGGNFFGFYRRGKESTEPHFYTQLGRVLQLEYIYSSTYKGVEVGRYHFSPKESLNATNNPANEQYNQLIYDGIFNTSSWLPVLYSWPHFYQGDPWLWSHFANFTLPNATADESYFDIQPTIGATCYMSRKLQANLPFGNLVSVPLAMNFSSKYYFPTWWLDVQVSLSESQAKDMKDALDFYDVAVLLERVLLFGGGGGALILFCISIYLFYKRRHYWGKHRWEALITDGFDDDEEEVEGVNIGGYMEDVTRRSPATSETTKYSRHGSY